ncbi:hypothetical protein ACHQM5_030099 [Ranunculus cassubicifolius]
MAVVGGTQSLRKALGLLKDSTTVGLAKVNSENKDLDIAIVKATNHVERTSKEKHIRTIFSAVAVSRPRADVAYCINALARRLSKTHNWAVALKSLIVIHRALREVDSTFREELINYKKSRGHMLNLSHFKDDSSPIAWDYSAWVRVYALYLEERLECFRILKYDVEADRSRSRELNTPGLLEHLPALQQLLFRLLACQPEGAAAYNNVIQYALAIVASESVRIYTAISDATLNLVDKFFEMQQHDAVRALEIYKRTVNQAERLSEFYETCRGFEFGKRMDFIKIEQPPASFITTLEEYVKEAPRALMLQWNVANEDTGGTSTDGTPNSVLSIKPKSDDEIEEEFASSTINQEWSTAVPVNPPIIDLLGFDEINPDPSEMDGNNSLALTIVNPEDPLNEMNGPSEITNWELALVTAPSSNATAITESKLGGGLDKLTLDSLYEDAMARSQYQTSQVAAPNPFESQMQDDPFTASAISHEAFMMSQQQHPVNPTNPFGDSFDDGPTQNPYGPHEDSFGPTEHSQNPYGPHESSDVANAQSQNPNGAPHDGLDITGTESQNPYSGLI